MKASKEKTTPRALIFDIDNTVFDWVTYYVNSLQSMLQVVEDQIGVPYSELAQQASKVFAEHGSIEYPFLVQELPAVMDHFGTDIDSMLQDLVGPSREAFKSTGLRYLEPYAEVDKTFKKLKSKYPEVPVVALTDAPRYVAMWKLNKLGLLPYFSAVYGLADPRIPTDPVIGRVKVDPGILLKHLQQVNFNYQGTIRTLPDEYEKPGIRGLKTVLMDLEISDTSDCANTYWVGDNLAKDIRLGKAVGVCSIWAKYGAQVDSKLMDRLKEFSPPENLQKNVSIDPNDESSPKPDFILDSFSDLLKFIP